MEGGVNSALLAVRGRPEMMVSRRMTETISICPLLVLILPSLIGLPFLLGLTLLLTESITLNKAQDYRGQLGG